MIFLTSRVCHAVAAISLTRRRRSADNKGLFFSGREPARPAVAFLQPQQIVPGGIIEAAWAEPARWGPQMKQPTFKAELRNKNISSKIFSSKTVDPLYEQQIRPQTWMLPCKSSRDITLLLQGAELWEGTDRLHLLQVACRKLQQGRSQDRSVCA